MSTDQWAKDYQKHTDNPPPEGTILRAYGGVDARLDLELVEGKPPFVYGRVYVPHIVGEPLGWFLQPFDSEADAYGWKCILLPKAREEALRRLGITEKRVKIRALKVVRYSQTGSSILCEIAEYASPSYPELTQDFVPGVQKQPISEAERLKAQSYLDRVTNPDRVAGPGT